MKPPFSYYGGKTRLAPLIASLLPPHRVYCEPFAGSAAVLFAKELSVHEILNDLNGDVVNFFRVLRERPEDLELACGLTPYSRQEYEACRDEPEPLDELERARRWWVSSNQSFGKMAKVGTGWSFSIQRGSNNPCSVANRLGRFKETALRLSTVVIECREAVEVINRCDAVDGVIYCDPPYLGSTRTSVAEGRRPGGDYFHEYHTDDEHRALAACLQAAKATVLISGYPSPLYEELYAGWARIERRVLRRSAQSRGSKISHATEVIWSNRPIVDQLQLVMETT